MIGLRLSVVCLSETSSLDGAPTNHAPGVGHLFSVFGSGDDNVRWDGPTRASRFLICPPHCVLLQI